ncbi:rRNA maturation RNase YbeY [Siphonobacter sp. BAB-5385]|uniref:Endoribonuclease YbeY n=1 Tax=Siphonobacter curvatus TaxID=2094562 RepID=A0A2S7IFB8_9BACT|nr:MULTISPECIES: rRNA maturation RNase YbeY [Siphonobacter]OZI07207.1 rRNA maturation RNase YbeY [Siphonobacter sp. BAB-5385]PMD93669.1 rRNA maturation RNase YbeY [Siphonobacter sp. BAB-5405]PQA53713.1 rRNA maturation RNase YbeY [Siphonobacter curvatus]
MIRYFVEDVEFQVPFPQKTRRWLNTVALAEGFQIAELNYIFCSDEYLHKINVEYLEHDTYTDIITFDNSEEEKIISGDIFVSVERVEDNARSLNVIFQDELARVMVHGVLHLAGYLDETDEEEENMRRLESHYLLTRI